MLDQHKDNLQQIRRSLFIVLVTLLLAGGAAIVRAQTPNGKPAAEEQTYNGYLVTATAEIGWRWRALDGNVNQYRSNLNYKPGFRTFDSNLYMRNDAGKGKYFDSLLISNSGWGADPNGYTRVNMEKIGAYKFNATVRRINYYNNLSTFVAVPDPNQHTQNTNNTMGDFDITFLPQNDKIRFSLGASIGNYTGPGTWTMRWNGDEFKTDSRTSNKSSDFRAGAEGKLVGFDWSLTQGLRSYKDRTAFTINTLNQGHALPTNTTPPNTTAVSSFLRQFPIDARAYFTQFMVHRTFAEKLDFTGRLLYSTTKTESTLNEVVSGRDASNNFIDQDIYTSVGNAKRPQTRGDIGITFNATTKFRISNSFTFDQFAINTGERFTQDATRRNAAGVAIAPTVARSTAYRYEAYRRFMNTLEADYQFTNRVSAHIGWRYTTRKLTDGGFDANTVTNVSTPLVPGESSNSTNTLIAGMKFKPAKGWTVYWDVEKGSADNVFTRLENYRFTNFRVRSKYTVNKFSFDLSVITKNNSNPEYAYPPGSTIVPAFGFTPITDIKSRFYSGAVTWDPTSKVSVSGGYTYRHQSTLTPIIFPYQACTTPACTAGTSVWNTGNSQFFMHDHNTYVEVAATPAKRVSLFATFRMDKDTGQDGLVSPVIPNTFGSSANPVGVLVYQNVIGGYPMTFTTPEFRVAFRLRKNVDWNVGYQYYKFTDVNNPSQSYRAQLPFTSLRFYFGGGAGDR